MKRVVLSLICFLMLVGSANAAMIFTDNTTMWDTTALTGYSTSGDMMDGMKVTVYYGSGGIATAIWADTDPGAGAAIKEGAWSLSESGDTYSNWWTFYVDPDFTDSITRIVINALVGDTVFDVAPDGYYTPDSAFGIATHNYDGTVVYSNPVSEDGTFYGDLYGMLDITLATALLHNESITFKSDTDTLSIAGDITPVPDDNPTSVPEPSTFLLMGLALGGLAFFRKKIAK